MSNPMAMNINPDWAAEIGNRDVRMKETTQPSQGNTGNHGGDVYKRQRQAWV